jgi:hypothetical protein
MLIEACKVQKLHLVAAVVVVFYGRCLDLFNFGFFFHFCYVIYLVISALYIVCNISINTVCVTK